MTQYYSQTDRIFTVNGPLSAKLGLKMNPPDGAKYVLPQVMHLVGAPPWVEIKKSKWLVCLYRSFFIISKNSILLYLALMYDVIA